MRYTTSKSAQDPSTHVHLWTAKQARGGIKLHCLFKAIECSPSLSRSYEIDATVRENFVKIFVHRGSGLKLCVLPSLSFSLSFSLRLSAVRPSSPEVRDARQKI